MSRFLLSHTKDLLIPSDARLAAHHRSRGAQAKRLARTSLRATWLIAAARLQPERADQILDEAERSYLGRADIPLASLGDRRAELAPESSPLVLWSERSEERLATEIVCHAAQRAVQSAGRSYLASPQRLRICNEAMYRFAEFAQKNKANFDRNS